MYLDYHNSINISFNLPEGLKPLAKNEVTVFCHWITTAEFSACHRQAIRKQHSQRRRTVLEYAQYS